MYIEFRLEYIFRFLIFILLKKTLRRKYSEKINSHLFSLFNKENSNKSINVSTIFNNLIFCIQNFINFVIAGRANKIKMKGNI